MKYRRFRTSFIVLALIVPTQGCADILGFRDGIPYPPDATGARSSSGLGDASAPDAPGEGGLTSDGAPTAGDGSTDARNFDTNSISDADGGMIVGGGSKLLGQLCADDGECSSSHCVDGVCCDSACTGSCQQCSAPTNPGYCAPVAAGQPAPPGRAPCATDDVASCKKNGLCDGNGACQLYPDGLVCAAATCTASANALTQSRCDGAGNCKGGTPTTCAPFRCNTGDTQCTRTCATNADCDGQPCVNNSCGKLKTGAACAANATCESGFCTDGVCCDTACTSECQACNLSSSVGTCSTLRMGQPVGGRAACKGTAPCAGTCAGQTTCSYPGSSVPCRSASCEVVTLTAGASCDGAGSCPALVTSTCPGNLRCTSGSATCLGLCTTPADCASGFFCSAGSCLAVKTNGAACATAAECASGFCVDGRCCDSSCTGLCMSCANASGTCSPVVNADDPGTCTGTKTCNAAQACVSKLGQPCSGAAECASGQCVDGVCCATGPCGTCKHCNLNGQGTCSNAAPGAADPACSASAANCMAGGCNGQGACSPAGLGVNCGTVCDNGAESLGQWSTPGTRPRVCNGTGTGAAACVTSAAAPQPCPNNLVCANATSCRPSCASHADCAFGTYCSGGTCVPANGNAPSSQFTCTDNIQCISRVCSAVFGDSIPHCHVCSQSYTCPITLSQCALSDECQACNPIGSPSSCNANGTDKCSGALCPANATDCDPATLQCHCGALDKCAVGQICINSQCKVAGLWPCVDPTECAYGTCTNGTCPQIPVGGFCTGQIYPIPECASGTCRISATPPGSATCGP